ncbi:unnamed protein product [Alternaria alternata]
MAFFFYLLSIVLLTRECAYAQSYTYPLPKFPLPTAALQKINGPQSLPNGPSYNQHTRIRPSVPDLRVFIAVALKDGLDLFDGAWGSAVNELIYQLGPNNVHLSVLEEHSASKASTAATDFENRVPSSSTIISRLSANISNHDTPKRRIVHMAEVRNEAFKPFYRLGNGQGSTADPHMNVPFDRILWLNDVFFNPADIVSLIYDTNGGDYAASCAMDFWDPFRLYDYFALRDSEGHALKQTTYPYFKPSKSKDQLIGGHRDIPVSSCWGGAIAFEAAPFYKGRLLFRDSGSSLWEASECCLVHADIGQPHRTFMNSRVRVAYDEWTFSWLGVTMRLQQLLAPVVDWYQDSTCQVCSKARFAKTHERRGELVLHDATTVRTGADGYCGWAFMMFMGQYVAQTTVGLPGRYIAEHQDGVDSPYWTSTLDGNHTMNIGA